MAGLLVPAAGVAVAALPSGHEPGVVLRVYDTGPLTQLCELKPLQTPNVDKRVPVVAQDEDGGSGVTGTEYRFAGDAEWTTYTGPFSVAREAAARVLEFRSVDGAGNVEQTRTLTVPAAVVVPDVPAQLSPATTCLAGKAALVVRVRWSGDPAATVTIESPLGSKPFTGVRTGSLLAHTFTSPAGYPAGELTVTAYDGSGAVTGVTSTAYSARSCG